VFDPAKNVLQHFCKCFLLFYFTCNHGIIVCLNALTNSEMAIRLMHRMLATYYDVFV